MKKTVYTVLLILLNGPLIAQVTMQINTSASNQKVISPYIYGLNGYVYDNTWGATWATGLSNHGGVSNLQSMNISAWRLGGNAMTSYNWEQGANNSGNDDAHKNSEYQSFIVTGASASAAPNFYTPAQAIVTTHNHALGLGAATLIQLPMAGYVAADITNTTCGTPSATPLRWIKVQNTKPTSLSLNPNLNDSVMYVDEEINFLKNQFGDATTTNGIKFYQTDNEVGLWAHYLSGGGGVGTDGTHAVMHPALTTCNEIINKTYELAKTIKMADPAAKVFSAGRWGYSEANSLWSIWDGNSHQPSDWATFNIEPYTTNNTGNVFRYNQMTWQNAYLTAMKQKEITEGKRLIDVLAIHYYPEGINSNSDRMQAPRSLWDSTYVENSWITQIGNGATEGRGLTMIPLTQRAINDFYPGTKLAITEYNFYGRDNITGTIAQADALGIFGKNDIYYATYFGTADQYISPAFKIYRNYDGANSTFGNIGVVSSTSNNTATSIYAAISDSTANSLHIVLINKNTTSITAQITINSTTNYTAITQAFGIAQADASTALSAKSKINTATGNSTIISNTFNYTMPAQSVIHLVVNASTPTSIIPTNSMATFSIQPNPASNEIILNSPYNITSLSIIDLSGRILASFNAVHNNNITIPIQQLSKGTYIIQVINDNGLVSNKKIIIN